MSMICMGLGSDGSGLEVAVALNPIEIPIIIKEVESIPIEVELKSIEIKKGRVIGKHGSARMQIEEETGAKIAVYGRTISIIGNAEGIERARRAVEMLLQGAKHTTTFRTLEHKAVKFEL